MKKFFLLPLLLLLLAVAGACYAIPPLVEDAIRRQINQLPAVLGQPGSVPEVGRISFDLFGRRLEIENVSLEGSIQDENLGAVQVVYRARTLSGVAPWRLFWLIGPFRNFAREEYGFETVLNNVSGTDISISVVRGREFQIESAIARFSGKNIMLEANVLGCILDQLPLDSLDFLYGIGVDEFSLQNIAGNLFLEGVPLTHKLANLRISGWRGQNAAAIGLSGLMLEEAGKNILRLDNLELEKVILPDMPLMVELKRDLAGKNPLGTLSVFHKIISGPPLLASARIHGLHDAQFGLDKGLLNWLSSSPASWNVSLAGLSMPAALVKKETGVPLAGMRNVSLDCDIAVEEKDGRMNHKGSLRSTNLGALAYSFSMEARPYNMVTILAAGISNFTADFVDNGLMARVAAGIDHNAQAAMMGLKIALGHFCTRETPDNEQLREAIQSFVERPGNLAIRARKAFTLAEIGTDAVMGDLGILLEAKATPGPRTLEQAMREVGQTRAR